jgi:hypothetical protein
MPDATLQRLIRVIRLSVPPFVQEIYGNKWSVVAQYIPGRTGQQCAQRWRHKVWQSS